MEKLGDKMIEGIRGYTIERLILDGDSWFSGYLTDDDIKDVETKTGKEVACSAESGEYFYKLK